MIMSGMTQTMWPVRVLCLIVLAVACLGADEEFSSVYPTVQDSVAEQVAEARACIDRWNAAGVGEPGSRPQKRMAAVWLHAHLHPESEWRATMLECSLKHLMQNVDPVTPLDMFVFARAEVYDDVKKQLESHFVGAGRLCLLRIPDVQWQHHRTVKSQYALPYNDNRYGDYLIMGQWRLLVPGHVISALGYPYFVQVDDDLLVTKPLKVNLVQYMQDHNMTFGNHRVYADSWRVMYGLPEMAKFYLVSNDIKPGGSLMEHVYPPGELSSLFSATKGWSASKPRPGYDLHILYGNFLIMSTKVWSSDQVQDFIKLCMASGGLERHRWQEQGVMAFIWLMFSEPGQLLRLTTPMNDDPLPEGQVDFHYIHSRDIARVGPMCGPSLDEAFQRCKKARAELRGHNRFIFRY